MAFSTIVDSLYCQEEQLDLLDYQQENQTATPTPTPASLTEEQQQTNLHLLHSLRQKESETNPEEPQPPSSLDYLLSGARKDMVAWVARTVSVHGFTAQTALLAVNYLDRCFLTGAFRLKTDKPWTGRLAAVACLSLAAKVEESHVPLLIDLQLPGIGTDTDIGTDDNGFLFEAKTVRRMELLVLSALEWRMNSITALSFVQPLVALLCAEKRGVYLTALCEGVLLSVLDDWRWVKYAPSVWATAALFHALEFDETQRLMSLIQVSKEKTQECYDLIQERKMAAANNLNRKRKRKHSFCKISSDHQSPPASPSAVISACFSCENSSSSSSNDSLGLSLPSSTTSSPDQPAKRTHYVSTITDYNYGLLRDEESRQAWQL